MISRAKKTIYLFEGITNFATVYYSNYLFFYMKKEYGFGELENLLLAALNGLVYTFFSWFAGRFAQKHGAPFSILIGTSGLIFSLLCGGTSHSMVIHILVYAFWTVSVCFIWPAIESIVSENENSNLSTMVGFYNITWAGSSAFAYFSTGIMLEKFGMQSIFWIPFGIHLLLLVTVFPIAIKLLRTDNKKPVNLSSTTQTVRPSFSKKFLYMAWLANPFSYIAINTVIPIIPTISQRLGLSTGLAGIICSIWMFARLGTFSVLWKWTGWHYRFRWIFGSFILMSICYAGILLTNSIFILLISQIGFGISIGVIYYSSLFYSMDNSDEKSSNGGLHEAMIGTGLFLGPAVGATFTYLLPSASSISGISINGLLLVGLTGLMWMGQFRLKKSTTKK